MISHLLKTSAQLSTLGAFQHAQINSLMRVEIAECMQKHNWTCHVCDISLPGVMEVDHLKGHSEKSKAHLKPICQFCHDRKHLLWSASKKRVRLIHAPDMDQVQVSQLAWSILVHNGQPGCTLDVDRIQQDLLTRATDAEDIIGCDSMEPFLEALMIYADSKGIEAAVKKAEALDAYLRIVPEVLFSDEPTLQKWGEGGFHSVGDDWKNRAKPMDMPRYANLWQAGKFLARKL
jgi:hypothetical protein